MFTTFLIHAGIGMLLCVILVGLIQGLLTFSAYMENRYKRPWVGVLSFMLPLVLLGALCTSIGVTYFSS